MDTDHFDLVKDRILAFCVDSGKAYFWRINELEYQQIMIWGVFFFCLFFCLLQ